MHVRFGKNVWRKTGEKKRRNVNWGIKKNLKYPNYMFKLQAMAFL